jgi:hypothetical protein
VPPFAIVVLLAVPPLPPPAMAWTEGCGPDFYWVGVTRRITHRARHEWQRQREAEAAAEGNGGAGT